MASWPGFNGKQVCAESLLCEYPKLVERIEILKNMLKTVREMDDDAIIEQYTLGRKPLDGQPKNANILKSNTEDLAFKMDSLRESELGEHNSTIKQITEEIRILQLYIALYEIVMGELSDDEKILVRAHYQQGVSLRRLAQTGSLSGFRFNTRMSLYRLQKLRKDIIQRVDSVLSGSET